MSPFRGPGYITGALHQTTQRGKKDGGLYEYTLSEGTTDVCGSKSFLLGAVRLASDAANINRLLQIVVSLTEEPSAETFIETNADWPAEWHIKHGIVELFHTNKTQVANGFQTVGTSLSQSFSLPIYSEMTMNIATRVSATERTDQYKILVGMIGLRTGAILIRNQSRPERDIQAGPAQLVVRIV
ncbi:hypothetical protein BKA67DRAFT_541526 [Truncatella angustata]|uniref:Uncharacterized protein n=1 Tax=Truncatella angustata TaxID=152316 RepID=A0A9P8RL56_9PEZI|nr:uncharacterized protein BKA67DRAFT_541526 [Truncatella angustata]KAH6645295.1 hypothetical protein BKA67DRAFT_541526 [Truncatella angustata]